MGLGGTFVSVALGDYGWSAGIIDSNVYSDYLLVRG